MKHESGFNNKTFPLVFRGTEGKELYERIDGVCKKLNTSITSFILDSVWFVLENNDKIVTNDIAIKTKPEKKLGKYKEVEAQMEEPFFEDWENSDNKEWVEVIKKMQGACTRLGLDCVEVKLDLYKKWLRGEIK